MGRSAVLVHPTDCGRERPIEDRIPSLLEIGGRGRHGDTRSDSYIFDHLGCRRYMRSIATLIFVLFIVAYTILNSMSRRRRGCGGGGCIPIPIVFPTGGGYSRGGWGGGGFGGGGGGGGFGGFGGGSIPRYKQAD